MRTAEGAGGLGLALFLRRGMTDWMQAWSECAGPADVVPSAQPSVDRAVPAGLRTQIAALLAGMILSQQQEVTL